MYSWKVFNPHSCSHYVNSALSWANSPTVSPTGPGQWSIHMDHVTPSALILVTTFLSFVGSTEYFIRASQLKPDLCVGSVQFLHALGLTSMTPLLVYPP